MTDSARKAIAAAVIFGIVAALSLFELPWQTRLGRTLQDAGHVFACAAIAIAALLAVRRAGAPSLRARLTPYAAAFAVSLVAGLVIEAIQLATGRGAEAGDLANDALGAGAGLATLAALDRELLGSVRRSRGLAIGFAVLGIGLTAMALSDVVLWTLAYRERDALFPTLLECSAVRSKRFLRLSQAHVDCGPAPAKWSAARGRDVAKASLGGSGLSLEEPFPDWRGFDALLLSVFIEAPEGLTLTLRVHDVAHDQEQHDRFNRRIDLTPGENRISIPLAEIAAAPRGRTLDLSAVAGLMLFGSASEAPQPIYIDAIWLE